MSGKRGGALTLMKGATGLGPAPHGVGPGV